jgi:Fe-S cluster assembly protein SufD
MTAAAGALLQRLVPAAGTGGGRADRGRAWLAAHGLPDQRAEAWRYTPVDDVLAALEAASPAIAGCESVDRTVVDELAGRRHAGPRLVFVDGAFAPALSDVDPLPRGLRIGGADSLRSRPRPALAPDDQPGDGFHALNWAAGRDVATVFVEPGVELAEPVEVVHLSAPGNEPTVSHPRTVVRAGPHSRLAVVETYAGQAGAYVTNASTRIVAGEGASITHHRLQAETTDAVHIGRTAIEQSRGSVVRSTSISTGSRIARSAIVVQLHGADASVELDGLYLPSGCQRHDHLVTVEHQASRGTSSQRFRGVVDDHARGSFSGHVVVRPGTTGTDARQENRNLLLQPAAQADTRPWLEILADDVRCTHGATVGRLDEEALFYLRSRGIAPDRARAMLVAAFAAEITDRISPAWLRARIRAELDPRLGAST